MARENKSCRWISGWGGIMFPHPTPHPITCLYSVVNLHNPSKQSLSLSLVLQEWSFESNLTLIHLFAPLPCTHHRRRDTCHRRMKNVLAWTEKRSLVSHRCGISCTLLISLSLSGKSHMPNIGGTNTFTANQPIGLLRGALLGPSKVFITATHALRQDK